MSASLAITRDKLIEAWSKIPDYPAADQVEDLVRRAHGLCDLIGWIDTHPAATRAEYHVDLARVKRLYPERAA